MVEAGADPKNEDQLRNTVYRPLLESRDAAVVEEELEPLLRVVVAQLIKGCTGQPEYRSLLADFSFCIRRIYSISFLFN